MGNKLSLGDCFTKNQCKYSEIDLEDILVYGGLCAFDLTATDQFMIVFMDYFGRSFNVHFGVN